MNFIPPPSLSLSLLLPLSPLFVSLTRVFWVLPEHPQLFTYTSHAGWLASIHLHFGCRRARDITGIQHAILGSELITISAYHINDHVIIRIHHNHPVFTHSLHMVNRRKPVNEQRPFTFPLTPAKILTTKIQPDIDGVRKSSKPSSVILHYKIKTGIKTRKYRARL